MHYGLKTYAKQLGIMLSFLLITLLNACAGTPETVKPTQPIHPPTVVGTPPAQGSGAGIPNETAIQTEIQAVLDIYAKAYNEHNPELLTQVTDQTNASFRRLVTDRFTTFQQSFLTNTISFSYTLQNITQRDFGFVQAHIIQHDGKAVDWLFRQINNQWVLSEPTASQIGERKQLETEHFTFYAYPWADDINQKLTRIMEQAHNRVTTQLGKAPNRKPKVYLKPIFGVSPIQGANTTAFYSSSKHAEMILIHIPFSFSFPAYSPQEGWEAELESILTHEYTHLVNDKCFVPLARESDWMVEGLAQYIADRSKEGIVREAVRSDTIIPIIDTSDKVDKQDLEHLRILEKDTELAYGLSYSLVAYINEEYGGMDGFWKLVRAYDETSSLDKALQQAFNIDYKKFDREWREWLKNRYK